MMTGMTDVDDLVKRLRDPAFGTETTERNLMDKAADSIDALAAKLADVEAEQDHWLTAEPSEQREKFMKVAARVAVGKASQKEAMDAITALCAMNERLAVASGKNKARAEAAEARIAHLEDHIEGVAKDTHKIMVAYYEAALPAVYRFDPRVKALQDKAQAVVDRWHSPLWKGMRHTGESIDELRDALSALEENK